MGILCALYRDTIDGTIHTQFQLHRPFCFRRDVKNVNDGLTDRQWETLYNTSPLDFQAGETQTSTAK